MKLKRDVAELEEELEDYQLEFGHTEEYRQRRARRTTWRIIDTEGDPREGTWRRGIDTGGELVEGEELFRGEELEGQEEPQEEDDGGRGGQFGGGQHAQGGGDLFGGGGTAPAANPGAGGGLFGATAENIQQPDLVSGSGVNQQPDVAGNNQQSGAGGVVARISNRAFGGANQQPAGAGS